ncbi:unnamed protein product [Parnassius apollo]|uniref:(apollo) hypothetical protein n=1 Tax=Parnassius apollo TaxID=110799 RepID=A0A8S3YAC5_PARAO|nr:unnamed protein product [Parnassius apollo]CAG5052578.1 unnamed protein product [Parnassius apollo]
MKTYSRKPIKHQIIEDVHKLCRLCLKKADESVSIYTSDKDNICASLAMRIMICVGFEVSRDDCLPNLLCTDCYKELERFYSFRKKCEMTYQKLKSHLLALKQKENDKADSKEQHQKLSDLDDMKNASLTEHYIPKDAESFNSPCKEDDKSEIVHSDVNNFVNGKVSLNNNVETQDRFNPEENVQSTVNPDLGTFLSTVLLELGILTRSDDKFIVMDNSIKTLELETGDGQYVVELMEEEEEQNVTQTENLHENNSNLAKQLDIEDNNMKKAGDLRAGGGGGGAVPQCGACGKQFATRSVLARHARVHSGARPYACRVCARAFAQRASLLRHELVHREKRPYQCAQCPKSFTQRGALAVHARSHAPPQQRPLSLHRCPRCPKLFLYASGEYTCCPRCPKLFLYASSECTCCPRCPKLFLYASSECTCCPRCPKLFLYASGEYTYCLRCPKLFLYASSECTCCPRCPKLFLYASGLSRHMPTHNGRVFTCGGCARPFRDKSSLLRHLRTAGHDA